MPMTSGLRSVRRRSHLLGAPGAPTEGGYVTTNVAPWRSGRGEAPLRDPRHPGRTGYFGRPPLHAGDGALLRPALDRGTARRESLRHDPLHGQPAAPRFGPARGPALRWLRARRLPGRVPPLLEGGMAAQGLAAGAFAPALPAQRAVGPDRASLPTRAIDGANERKGRAA